MTATTITTRLPRLVGQVALDRRGRQRMARGNQNLHVRGLTNRPECDPDYQGVTIGLMQTGRTRRHAEDPADRPLRQETRVAEPVQRPHRSGLHGPRGDRAHHANCVTLGFCKVDESGGVDTHIEYLQAST